VREKGRPVANDRADERPGHRQIAKRLADELALRTDGDVEYLVPVLLEHGHLLRARVVGEPDDLLGRERARVDCHVDPRLLEDVHRDVLVSDGDRERCTVELGEHRGVEVLAVILHREDRRVRLADALALEEVGIEARCEQGAGLREAH
jgi:hypothetical protein